MKHVKTLGAMLALAVLAACNTTPANPTNPASTGNNGNESAEVAENNSGAQNSGEQHACDLLTEAEVENTTGWKMKAAEPAESDVNDGTVCTFFPEDEMSMTMVHVELIKLDEAVDEFVTGLNSIYPGDVKDESGFQDRALYTPLGLFVIKGDYYLLVTAGNLMTEDAAERKQMTMLLARIAADRMA
jgi:hypothetical protein